jgi:hypothetical protein
MGPNLASLWIKTADKGEENGLRLKLIAGEKPKRTQGLFRTFEDFEFRAGFSVCCGACLHSIGAEASIYQQGDIVGRDSSLYHNIAVNSKNESIQTIIFIQYF